MIKPLKCAIAAVNEAEESASPEQYARLEEIRYQLQDLLDEQEGGSQ